MAQHHCGVPHSSDHADSSGMGKYNQHGSHPVGLETTSVGNEQEKQQQEAEVEQDRPRISRSEDASGVLPSVGRRAFREGTRRC